MFVQNGILYRLFPQGSRQNIPPKSHLDGHKRHVLITRFSSPIWVISKLIGPFSTFDARELHLVSATSMENSLSRGGHVDDLERCPQSDNNVLWMTLNLQLRPSRSRERPTTTRRDCQQYHGCTVPGCVKLLQSSLLGTLSSTRHSLQEPWFERMKTHCSQMKLLVSHWGGCIDDSQGGCVNDSHSSLYEKPHPPDRGEQLLEQNAKILLLNVESSLHCLSAEFTSGSLRQSSSLYGGEGTSALKVRPSHNPKEH